MVKFLMFRGAFPLLLTVITPIAPGFTSNCGGDRFTKGAAGVAISAEIVTTACPPSLVNSMEPEDFPALDTTGCAVSPQVFPGGMVACEQSPCRLKKGSVCWTRTEERCSAPSPAFVITSGIEGSGLVVSPRQVI